MDTINTALEIAKNVTKIAASVGATEIATNACKVFCFPSPRGNKLNDICLRVGTVAIAGAVSMKASAVIEDDFQTIKEFIDDVRQMNEENEESEENKEETDEEDPDGAEEVSGQ